MPAVRSVAVVSFCLVCGAGALGQETRARAEPPWQVHEYLPFFVTYGCYSEGIWHEVEGGGAGYWGDGLAGGNGGIRGTSNVTLMMAMLVYAYDEGWLGASHQEALAGAGLGRDVCLERVSKSWVYLAQGHVTGDGRCAADGKSWGHSWQSPLWVGASGLAALIVWDDLDEEIRRGVERVVVDEAGRKISVEPRDASPGNTAAEENGWDTHAPAIAVALFPEHPNVPRWLRAAQVLAANTHSVAADHESDARLGDDRVGDVVTTTNLADDFTLDNHGFFHPSYLKVSGQELGEAWAMLAWGDRRHGTSFAPRFRPYALHHVGDAWRSVLRPLLLPEGEFAYPSGQDWAVHISTIQSYFAFVATALGDRTAALAERRGFMASRRRMAASSDGRIFGATNFEWWWDPIFVKRATTAMLHFILAPQPTPEPAPESTLRGTTESFFFPAAGIVVHRTPLYFASVSTRGRPTGLMIPLGERHLEHPYLTTPRVGSILPPGTIESFTQHDHALGRAVVMQYAGGSRAAMVGLESVVLWVTAGELSPIAIQNDNTIGTGRRVHSVDGPRDVPALEPMEAFSTSGTWLNVDDQIGLITEGGFRYVPAGQYTRRSAAEDLVNAIGGPGHTGLLAAPRASAAETERLARTFSIRRVGQVHEVRLRDGVDGPLVCVKVDLGRLVELFPPEGLSTEGQVSENNGLEKMTDGDPATCTVLRTPGGVGPVPEAPVILEFRKPAGAEGASGVRIVPRPGYGPRAVTLEVNRAGAWQPLAKVEVGSQHKDIELADHDGADRFRLTISTGWDRGAQLSHTPRNTQIAELSFLVAEKRPEPSPGADVPFQLRVLEADREE